MYSRNTRHRRFFTAARALAVAAAFAALVVQATPAAESSIVINEIMTGVVGAEPGLDPPDSTEDHQWVELYNPGPGGVDVGGWIITGRNATPLATLPVLTLPQDAYLVVHFTSGVDDTALTDSVGHYYAGGDSVFADSMDECALFCDTPDETTLVDFVAYVDWDTTFSGGTAYGMAVTVGQWPIDEAIPLAYNNDDQETLIGMVEGGSLGRDSLGTDTDQASDWNLGGGRHAYISTMASRNFEPATSVSEQRLVSGTKMPASQRKWLIMVYSDCRDAGTPDSKGIRESSRSELIAIEAMIPATNRNYDIVVQLCDYKDKNGQPYTPRYWVDKNENSKGLQSKPDTVLTGDAGAAWRPENLTAFVDWSKSEFPATNYALFLCGHGNGWKGMLAMGSNGDNLNMDELRTAFTDMQGGLPKVDVLALENCRMGMVEVAAQLDDVSEYVIASQATRTLFSRWKTLLKGLFASRTGPGGAWTPKQFAKEAWKLDIKTQKNKHGQKTLAIINMSRVNDFTNRMTEFSDKLMEAVEETHDFKNRNDNGQVKIRDARNASFEYGDKNYIDLWHFADRVRARSELTAVWPSAGAIKDMLSVYHDDSLVVARWGRKPSQDRGLSIYFPQKMTQWTGSKEAPMDDPRRLKSHPQPDYRYIENLNCTPVTDPDKHPLEGVPNFQFVANSTWGGFLERYFEPAAEAAVGHSEVFNNELKISIKTAQQVGFTLTAKGSSDIDQADGELQPQQWHWDNNILANQDAHDADWDCVNEVDDDIEWSEEETLYSLYISSTTKLQFMLTVLDDHDTLATHTDHHQARQSLVTVTIVLEPDNPKNKSILITEVMRTPVAAPEPQAEWFEVLNADTASIDLNGWTIGSGGAAHTVNNGGPLVIGPGEWKLFARDRTTMEGEGVVVFYEYGSAIEFDEALDNLVLSDGGVAEDSIAWDTGGSWPSMAGSSMQFFGEGDSEDGAGWSVDGPEFGSGDRGTPGQSNHGVVTATEPPAYADELFHNYPNPFNPVTTLRFTLDESGQVSLVVYDVKGRVVRTLHNGPLGPGLHERKWDGRDNHGQRVATGVYFYRLLTASGYDRSRKMVLLK